MARKTNKELRLALYETHKMLGPFETEYRHVTTGEKVKMMCVGYKEDDLTILVGYMNADAVLFLRPLTEFLDGRFART